MFDKISNLWYYLFGLDSPGDEEGISWSLSNSWQWAPWVTVTVVLLLIALVSTIYWFEIGNARRRIKILLGTIRCALFLIVLGMIASWMLILQRNDLPYLLVFIDDSESMQHIDSFEKEGQEIPTVAEAKQLGFSKTTRLNLAKTILLDGKYQTLQELSTRYKLRVFRFSENANLLSHDNNKLAEQIKKLEPTGTQTKIGDSIRTVLDELRGNSIAGIVLLSDGITTQGSNLSELAEISRRKTIPLYMVGLGSDVPKQDLALRDLIVDDVVFVGDEVRFQVTLSATGFSGREVVVRLYKKNNPTRIINQQQVKIDSQYFNRKISLSYEPRIAESAEFELEVEPLKEETAKNNNRIRRTITVKQSNIRVLFVQSYPSYEYRFIKHMLERELVRNGSADSRGSKNELTTILQEADPENSDQDKSAARIFPINREKLFQYDVILFGDVDPSFLSQGEMQNIYDFVVERGGGLVFLAGERFTPKAYQKLPLAKLMPIQFDSIGADDPDEILSKGFKVLPTEFGFSLPQMQLEGSPSESRKRWNSFEDLFWSLKVDRLKEGTHVLATHSTAINSRGNPLPLITLNYAGTGKVIFHMIDGTWRWRYRAGDKYLARYWIQTIRFLTRSQLLDPTRVAELKVDALNDSSRNVRLRLRYFNPGKAPQENIKVRVQLDRNNRKDRTLALYPHPTLEGVFQTNVMGLAAGTYHAQVISPVFEQAAPATDFSVEMISKETQKKAIDITQMSQAAKLTNGKFYQLSPNNNLAKNLLNDLPLGTQVMKQRLPPFPLWNSWPIPILFFALLITEWIIRKRKGML